MSSLAMLFLLCGPGAVLSSQSNSMSPGTPSHLEPVVVEREDVETLSVLRPGLGGGLARFLVDVHEALPPVLSALFVYMFACSVPRFQL